MGAKLDLPAVEYRVMYQLQTPPSDNDTVPKSTDMNSKLLSATPQPSKTLTSLPLELIDEVLSYLSPIDLARVSRTTRLLRSRADADIIWSRIVNANLPSPLRNPAPSPTFKDLYVSHHPLWFLVRNKIWFSDVTNTGKLILARYNEKLGRIEAYRLVTSHTVRHLLVWEHDPSVRVMTFEPEVALWLDDPVVLVDKFVPTERYPALDWHGKEIQMPMALEAQRVFSRLILCKKMPELDQNHPSRDIWPPRTIPTDERVDTTYTKFQSFQNLDNKPRRLGEICQSAFRVRRWIQFGGRLASFNVGTVMDGISTYSTLQPGLYTPTAAKPYQGIWVGDYSVHGSEFLLVIQRESIEEWQTADEEVDAQHESASTNGNSINEHSGEDLPRGMMLEAIKLTGDPNVPRGEISFASDDIGPRGFLRVADEELFKGARVVRSRGQVAATNFRDRKSRYLVSTHLTVIPNLSFSAAFFIPTELFLISHNCIAHYWKQLGHISYYRRVDIDQLLQGN